jgi:hypothetical protein
MELVPRLPAERAPLVRADLGGHAELTQEAESPTSRRGAHEVEVESDLPAPAQVEAPGRVCETRELGKAVALPLRRDPRKLVAKIFRQ